MQQADGEMDFLLLFLFNGSFSVYTAQADKSVLWTAEIGILRGAH